MNGLREAIVAANQSGKGYKAISKQSGVHHSTERTIIHKWKTFKTAANVPWSSPKGQTVQCSEILQKIQELHVRFYRPEVASKPKDHPSTSVTGP